MKIINIVDNIEKINFGIWNAAIATASSLQKNYGVESELWFPKSTENPDIQNCTLLALDSLKAETINDLCKQKELTPETTIVVTHGCWRFPTVWGHTFKLLKFKWIYVPHGMLEPWSLQQKRQKKWVYFHLFEHRYSKHADLVRAVGVPEQQNLNRVYTNTIHIPNCIDDNLLTSIPLKNKQVRNFLFMARLHHKKGVIPLAKAWLQSEFYNHHNYKLLIAGPDDGELAELQHIIPENSNIQYVGAKYGEEKNELLRQSHYYILPSQSEGFPTSVLEAMQYGAIPIVTDGCNFPELFENQLAIRTEPNEESILKSFQQISNFTEKQTDDLAEKSFFYVKKHYISDVVANQQYSVFTDLLA